MRFIIVGAGAMGCLYGAKLKQAGQEVILISSRRETADSIMKNGVLLKTELEENTFSIPAYLADEYVEMADAILLFTKSIHSRKALSSVAKNIGEHTLLISFQNGIGNDEIMKEYAAEDRIIIGTTNFPSDRIGEGIISSKGDGVTCMMTASGTFTTELQQLKEVFDSAGLHPQIAADIYRAIWEKVAFNASLNSLTGITLIPQGYLGQTCEGNELAHTIVREVCAVARAKQISVREEKVHAMVDRLLTEHFEHCPSMLQDILAHRCTEIESINGAVVREAAKLGVEAHVTKVMYYLISVVQQTYEHRLV